ncbi:MAG: RIP metalloprotease RseP [Xanthomonadaceae bacterium]|nr:RIP metalloprotease RseP [Xanthomonadaceae bacterium]
MSFLIALASFIVALGILVTVHEYGHFWVARRAGVQVLRFSVGFGRPIWSRTASDGTEYVIAAIPLGGYVKMLDERDPDMPASADVERSFNRTTPLRKVAITLAGPAANFLFAIFAYWMMFVIGIPGLQPVVGAVTPDSPAAHAGLEAGDRFVRIDGSDTPTWEAALLALLEGVITNEPFEVEVVDTDGYARQHMLAAGAARPLTEPGSLLPGIGIAPWRPRVPAFLGDIEAGGAADAAGLRSGDHVLALDGEPVADWEALVGHIRARPGERVLFQVERAGALLELPVQVGAIDSGEAGGGVIGRVGAGVSVPADLFAGMESELRYGPVAALPRAARRMVEMSVLTVKMLGSMVVGDVSVKNISGPINIAQYAGYSASVGLVPFLAFLAIVSISLGIINLLPIPILDGGHLVYHLVELVKGRPVSEQTEIVGQRIGLGMLAMLMGLAFYNDLARIFG